AWAVVRSAAWALAPGWNRNEHGQVADPSTLMLVIATRGSSTHLGYQVRSVPVDASKCGNQTNAERSSFRSGLSPSDGNRNQQAIATRSPCPWACHPN
ncbi:MAG: hypothetical protein ACK6A7_17855, partial [Planctomycetota bacterium]